MVNEHIVEYLNDYLGKPSPVGYAVLITGAWGSGKTFFTKHYFDCADNVRHLYVSLHGVSTEEELRNRFVFAAYPLLESKKARAFGSIARSAIGVFGIKSDLTAKDLFEYDQFDVLVVDDIERAMLRLETVLGFISQLVEQEGRRVVLIGSENVLRNETKKFKDIKEKTIGFTLELEPDVVSMLAAIIEKSPPALAATILRHALHIAVVFSESKTNNLRVLGQVLVEYAPIANVLEADHRLTNSYKEEVLGLFLAISTGYKTGEIDRSDIIGREKNKYLHLFEETPVKVDDSAMARFDASIKSVDLYSLALDNDYLESKICNGLHREEFLARTVGDAASQSDPDSNPEWRNVWNFMHGDDDLTKSSFCKVMQRFESREYKDAGEILHVFGILLEMRGLGLLGWSEARVLKEGKAYLDDLAGSGELPAFGDDYLGGFRHGAAHGLGFMSAKNAVFNRLSAYFQNLSRKVKQVSLLDGIGLAASQLSKDPTAFSKAISSSDGDNKAYSTGVLQHLNARDFATEFMASDGDKQFAIMLALGTRYTSNPYSQVLELERPWLKKLRRAINGQLRGRDRLTKVRISRLMAWNLDDFIQDKETGAEALPDEE